MNTVSTSLKEINLTQSTSRYAIAIRSYFAGALISFGFAPFHRPGFALLGIALLFAQLNHNKISLTTRSNLYKQALFTGFCFGLGIFSIGVSWIFVSIHTYGHLHPVAALIITALFVMYLALYPALIALIYTLLSFNRSKIWACLLFSALWCFAEYARSTIFGGFPWLLLGFSQIDTPIKWLLPIVGVYGAGFLSCLAASFLSFGMLGLTFSKNKLSATLWIILFIAIILAPNLLSKKHWTHANPDKLSVAVVQANLSMRDKWDEDLFWNLLTRYQESINPLLGHKDLIVLPESAIPIPADYISDILNTLDRRAKQTQTAILYGIPQRTGIDKIHDYNSMTSLGHATGMYFKQHLVPFGEYIPKMLEPVMEALSIPITNLTAGSAMQPLIQVHGHPVASLICYELAYPNLLRNQLPKSEWIVSISDDGWFGHSLAMYQQLQIAQVLSQMTERYQIMANNDGLSSVINTQGEVITSLPAQSAGILNAFIKSTEGSTPWVELGDTPILIVCLTIILLSLLIICSKIFLSSQKIV